MPHDHHDHLSPSGHPYRPDNDHPLTYWQEMEIAVRELLIEKGVTTALEVIQKELDTTMALCGEKSVTNLGRHNRVYGNPHIVAARLPFKIAFRGFACQLGDISAALYLRMVGDCCLCTIVTQVYAPSCHQRPSG